MTVLERRMLTIALLLGLLTAGVASGKALAGSAWQPPVAQAATGSFYGADESYVAAGAWEWPQKANNWCGVATVEVVANYTYQLVGGISDTPFMSGGQQRIANDMNSGAAVSEWGTPSWNGIGPGFGADIANDGGTDPRSLAWALDYESTTGPYWHYPPVPTGGGVSPGFLRARPATFGFNNIIYHGLARMAVPRLARTLEQFGMPISVTMAHGLHSDVVSGVFATNDPITAFPANIDAVNTWDPAVGTSTGGYQSAREVTWDNYSFNTNANMWGSYYSSNNGYDPDPSVGLYTPNGQYPTHWINTLTDIEPDAYATLSPDFALDENGAVMTHP